MNIYPEGSRTEDGEIAPRLHPILQRLRLPDAHRVIARAGDELLAVGPPRQRIDVILVPAKPRDRLERLGVPQTDVVVVAAAGDALAVRAQSSAARAIPVSDQVVQPRARRGISDPHDPIFRGRHDSAAVGTEGH